MVRLSGFEHGSGDHVSLEEHWAKEEILRLNDFIERPLLLIGGLAVQRYSPGRQSQDLDLVCELADQKRLLRNAYPLTDYDHEENQGDLRPDFIITHRKSGRKTLLGSKILEREPYPNLDYELLREGATPFRYDNRDAIKVLVPLPHALAYTKLLAFLARRNDPKGGQDLQDFSDLTNHRDFSVTNFIALAERSGAEADLNKQLTSLLLTQEETRVIRLSSLFRFANLFPFPASLDTSGNDRNNIDGDKITVPIEQLETHPAILLQNDIDSFNLITAIQRISSSKWGHEFSRYFREVLETQFSSGLFRRNWDIQIKYDFSEIDAGIVKEIIDWEYELINSDQKDIETEIALTHAKNSSAGQVQRLYSMNNEGKRQEIKLLASGSFEGHHWKRDAAKVTLKPDQPYFVTLYYVNKWNVNPNNVKIHNALTSKHPCLGCRMRFNLPHGFRVSLLKGRIIEPNIVNNVFDVRFAEPLLAEQKIEYVLERVESDDE
jgi:hypothetical protein